VISPGTGLKIEASQEGESKSGEHIGGSEGGEAGGIEVGRSAADVGDCHAGMDGGDGGGKDAHKDSSCTECDGDCAGSSVASHGGGTDAWSERVNDDGACNGGGGGIPIGPITWAAALFAISVCKLGGKLGACIGGGGIHFSTAMTQGAMLGCSESL